MLGFSKIKVTILGYKVTIFGIKKLPFLVDTKETQKKLYKRK